MPIPIIGAALAAVAPALAERGLDLLSGIFRGAMDQGAEKVAEMIKENVGIDVHDVAENKITEEQWVKLKEFELAHQEQLLKFRQSIDAHALEMEKLRVQGVKGARETQSGRDSNEDPFIRRFTYYYAYMITGLTFMFIFVAIFMPFFMKDGTTLPVESWQVINTVLGFLLGVSLSAIIQFFFGSSKGSQEKSNQINTLLSQVAASSSSDSGRRKP